MTAPVTLALTHTRQQYKITIKQISSQPAAYKTDRNLIYDAYEHDPQGHLKSVVRSGPSEGRLVATRTLKALPLRACAQARKSGDIVLGNRSLSPAYGLAASSDGAKVFRYEPRSTSPSETAGSNRIPEQDLQWGDCEAAGQFTLTIHLAPMKRSADGEIEVTSPAGAPMSSVGSGSQ